MNKVELIKEGNQKYTMRISKPHTFLASNVWIYHEISEDEVFEILMDLMSFRWKNRRSKQTYNEMEFKKWKQNN